jgi:hypothetical protein
VSFAAFRKNLLSYITYGVSARDNTFLPRPTNLDPSIVVQQFGPVFQPLNGSGGKVELLLVERQVLLISSHYSILTVAAEGLLAAMFPFVWQHVYIPFLPQAALDALQGAINAGTYPLQDAAARAQVRAPPWPAVPRWICGV